MNRLSIEEKVDLIISQAEKHNITAYEFGNNTEISTFAAEQLLKRKTKKPGKKTISAMWEYIEKRIVGTNLDEEKENRDPPSAYRTETGSPSIQDQIATRILELLMPEVNEIRQEVMKAILNLDLEVAELRNTQEELLRIQKELLESQKQCSDSVKVLEQKL